MDGDPVDGSDPSGNPVDPAADPALCVGGGASGTACEVTANCDAPAVCVSGVCVAPEDPEVMCDSIENIECADPAAVCVASVCVLPPGSCETTDQCPVGFLCAEGQCQPSRDGTVCADPGPGPELAGTWAMTSNLHLRAGVPGLADGFLDISELFRDFLQGDIDLGLPGPVELLIGVLVRGIIEQNVPQYAQQLVVALAGISDVLDTMTVDSTVTLAGTACDAGYRGSSVWNQISFEYNGQPIVAVPEQIPEIGRIEPEEFGARYSCGQLYIDRHRVKNVLSGLVRWVVNTIIEASTGYATVEAAIDAAIDCPAIARGVANAWQRTCNCQTDLAPVAQAACSAFEVDLLDRVTMLLDGASVRLSVLSMQGVAEVASPTQLQPGTWYGSVIGFDFPGELSATRQ